MYTIICNGNKETLFANLKPKVKHWYCYLSMFSNSTSTNSINQFLTLFKNTFLVFWTVYFVLWTLRVIYVKPLTFRRNLKLRKNYLNERGRYEEQCSNWGNNESTCNLSIRCQLLELSERCLLYTSRCV